MPLDQVLSVTFNKALDSASINGSSFTVSGTAEVEGTVSYEGMTATFTPAANLATNTHYTGMVTTEIKDEMENNLQEDYVWSFTTVPEISLYKNLENAGTLTGAGTFDEASLVTVVATSNSGFTFINWTYEGTIVSGSSSYEFEMEGNRELIANFAQIAGSDLQGIELGSSGDFVVLSGDGITNTGISTKLYGDVGSFPTATITGLDASNVEGTLYTSADPIVEQAKIDLTSAYNNGQERAENAISLPGQLGGLTLAPGLYVNSSTTGISGTGPQGILTLDGDADSVWIFKMGSTLITDPGTSIVLSGGAQAKNIFWIVGSSATLGTTSVFYGNILADISITMKTEAVLNGSAMARTGSINLDSNEVTKP